MSGIWWAFHQRVHTVLVTPTSYVIGIDPGPLKSGFSTNCSSKLEIGIAKELKNLKTKPQKSRSLLVFSALGVWCLPIQGNSGRHSGPEWMTLEGAGGGWRRIGVDTEWRRTIGWETRTPRSAFTDCFLLFPPVALSELTSPRFPPWRRTSLTY